MNLHEYLDALELISKKMKKESPEFVKGQLSVIRLLREMFVWKVKREARGSKR